MAGVSEQVNKEVNKSLAERGFPATQPEQQLLLKGQICAVIEPNNAVYKLMSRWLQLILIEKHTQLVKDLTRGHIVGGQIFHGGKT